MRLDKLLSNLGFSSRSLCREMIKKGRVQVDGIVCRDMAMHVKDGAKIALDGKEIDTRTQRHLMLYKPAGYLTAAEDQSQKTVMDLLPGVYRSLGCMPVGRLDKDTTGLLLFTTDGDLAHRLIAPKHHVDKVYFARVDGEMTEEDEEEIERLKPDIALLCGGTDGGNSACCIHNAGVLARVKAKFPVVVACNRSAIKKCVSILEEAGKETVTCENVMPQFGQLNILPTQKAIRDLFLRRIVSAKGLSLSLIHI